MRKECLLCSENVCAGLNQADLDCSGQDLERGGRV